MDLYSDARRLPLTLRDRRRVWLEPDLRRAGLSRRALQWRTARGRLQRPHRERYLAGAGDPDLLERVKAALSVCARGTVVGFQTAAALYGFGVQDTDTVHVLVPAGSTFPQRPGISVHQTAVPVGSPAVVLGVPCAPPARCAVDLARTLTRMEALPFLDAALYARVTDPDALATELAFHSGLRGVVSARELVLLADGRAQCRQESQLRLILHDGGIRGFEPQVEIVDPNTHTCRIVDLGDRHHRIGVEYDGRSHWDRDRLHVDRARHNWLDEHGWRMRYFTDHDIYRRPTHILTTIQTALAQTTLSRGAI